MASPHQAACRKIPPKEQIERLESELKETQRAYVVLEMLIECLVEAVGIAGKMKQTVSLIQLQALLVKAIACAHQEAMSFETHDESDAKIFCDACHTFLSEASEQAGYCLKCEGRN